MSEDASAPADAAALSPLERARLQLEQARARLQRLEARERSEERKRDTRRKVILGGALIELAARDADAAAMIARLVRGLSREPDRKAFEGWSPPAPDAKENGSEGRADGGTR